MWNQKVFEESYSDNPKYLVVLLHGYGANATDLIELSPYFAESLPNAHFIAPNAIQNWEGGFPDAYQWFSLSNGITRKSIEETAQDIKDSNKKLKDFIDQKLLELNIDAKNLFIIGFSQGAMMAKYQGLINDEEIAGVIGFSGKLILPEVTGENIKSKPKICLIHGQDDDVVDFSNFIESKKILESLNITYEAHSLENLGHSINIEGIKIAADFLKNSTQN